MLTIFKELFVWWNRQTLGTRIHTFLFGKFVGEDKYGNKYYKDSRDKRWVIYKKETEATNIPQEWYSWIHHIGNNIEKKQNLEKYKWQKEHTPNQTGTSKAYSPNKKNATEKKYTTWKS